MINGEIQGKKPATQAALGMALKEHLKTLKQYVPVVARVHGGHHPEFYEVQKLFDTIQEKTKKGSPKPADLAEEFSRLRAVTNQYTVPDDVCESYEAVYMMMAKLDEAFHTDQNESYRFSDGNT